MNKRISAFLLLATLAAAPSIGAAAAPATTPDTLRPPAGHVLRFSTVAAGVQLYTCKEQPATPGTFAWTFKAPEAVMWQSTGAKLGTHYAGPTWEGNDGSKVVAEVAARVDNPESGAIPWLLLKAKANEGGGIFSSVSYIQRLDTTGGLAPTDGCDHGTVDTERAVTYTAVYAFFGLGD